MDSRTGQIYRTQEEVDALPKEVRDRLVSGPLAELQHLSGLVKTALTKNQAKAARRKAKGKR